MGAEYQVVVARVDHQIVEWQRRHVVLQLDPVLTTVDRYEQPQLAPQPEHVGVARVFADGAEYRVGRQIADDRGPRFAEVRRTVQVVVVVVVAVVVDDDVHRPGLVPGSLDPRDPGGIGDAGEPRGDVRPSRAPVPRHLQIPVIGTGVQHPLAQRRLLDRGERRVVRDAVIDRGYRIPDRLPHDREVAPIDLCCEIAERGPRATAVGALPQLVRPGVEHVVVVRRDQVGAVPVRTRHGIAQLVERLTIKEPVEVAARCDVPLRIAGADVLPLPGAFP